MFHRHKYILKDNVLYCECGKFKILPCQHVLVEKETMQVTLFGSIRHLQRTYKCEKCGRIQIIDMTSGCIEKKIDDN